MRTVFAACTSLSSAILLTSVASAQSADTSVQLHVDAPVSAEILGRPREGIAWRPVCTAPCDSPVSLDWQYAVQPTAADLSHPFRLRPTSDDDATVRVRPGSWPVRAIGAGLAILGVPLTLVGVAVATSGPSTAACPGFGASCPGPEHGPDAMGIAMIVLGAVALVGGNYLAFVNSETRVEQTQ